MFGNEWYDYCHVQLVASRNLVSLPSAWHPFHLSQCHTILVCCTKQHGPYSHRDILLLSFCWSFNCMFVWFTVSINTTFRWNEECLCAASYHHVDPTIGFMFCFGNFLYLSLRTVWSRNLISPNKISHNSLPRSHKWQQSRSCICESPTSRRVHGFRPV